jgi:predicted Zn-dependent protease
VVILSLSAFAMASLVGHQAIERGRDRLAAGAYQDALTDARLAERLLPWSAEPPAIVGAAELRLGSLEAGRAALRRSAAKDPADWVSWYRLAVGSSGVERQRALARARTLNPREQLLTRPG